MVDGNNNGKTSSVESHAAPDDASDMTVMYIRVIDWARSQP